MNATTHPYLTSVETTTLLGIRSHASEELKAFLAEFEITPLVLGSGEKRKHYRWLRQAIETKAEQIKRVHKARLAAAKQPPAPTPQMPLPGVEAAPAPEGQVRSNTDRIVEALDRIERGNAWRAEQARDQRDEQHDMLETRLLRIEICLQRIETCLVALTPTAEV